MTSVGEPVEVSGKDDKIPTGAVPGAAVAGSPASKVEEDVEEVCHCCFVNFLVLRPCVTAAIAMAIILVCTIISVRTIMVQGSDLFSESESNEIGDIRTKEWEAFRSASAEARAWAGADEEGKKDDEKTYPQQTQGGPVVLKIYIAKDSDNVFTSDNLEQIRAVEDFIIEEPDFENFCLRADRGGNDTTCQRPLSPLNVFYVANVNVKNIFDQLDALDNTTDGKLDVFATPHLSSQLATLHTSVFSMFSGNLLTSGPAAACLPQLAQGQAAVFDCLSPVVVSMMNPPPSQTALDVYRTTVPLVFALGQKRSRQQQDVQATLKLAAYMKTVGFFAPQVDYYFDKDFSVANPKSKYSRGMIQMGYPLEGYKNRDVDAAEQGEVLEKWFSAAFTDYLKDTKDVGGVEVLFFATPLVQEEFIQILLMDALMVFVSLALVFCWIWLQTTSLFIAICGVLEIVLSVPVAFMIYYSVFQLKYFDGLNMMTIFIVTAIGADDIFVFMDQYKMSAYIPEICVDLKTRMNWVYSRAATAMFVTSLTTCAAFVCTAFSPLPNIQSFGIFSAFVIIVDFVFVITWFPACVVLYHNYLEFRPCPCMCNKCNEMWPCQLNRSSTTTEIAAQRSSGEVPEKRFMERLLSGKFASFLGRFALPIVILFLLLVIPCGYLASEIKELSSAEEFLPSDHPFQRLFTLSGEVFPSSAQLSNTPVYLVWGIKEMDTSGLNKLRDPKAEGTLKWDDTFVFNEATQQHIWNVCDEVRRMDTDGLDNFLSRDSDSPENSGKVSCPMEDWKSFVVQRNETFPLPLEQVPTTMASFLSFSKDNEYGQPQTMKEKWSSQWGWDPIRKELRVIILEVESKLLARRPHPSADLEREYNSFTNWVNDINDPDGRFGAPESAGKAFQTSDGEFNGPNWVWMHTQSLYQKSAIQGAIIGTVLAFVVILVATQQIIIAIASFVSIACILASVLAAMRLADYEMGNITSICITILAGFAVDYVVHLAHAYNHSKCETRAEKFQDAIDVIGVSVLSGMVTSVVAAAVLMFCNIQFFAKFGFFLFFTVAFAWIWGNLFFMCVMKLVGPDQNTHWLLQLPYSRLPNMPEAFRWKKVPVAKADMKERDNC